MGSDQEENLMRDVFSLACQDGALNVSTLNVIRKRFPKRLLEDLLGTNYVSVALSDLPTDWSRRGGES